EKRAEETVHGSLPKLAGERLRCNRKSGQVNSGLGKHGTHAVFRDKALLPKKSGVSRRTPQLFAFDDEDGVGRVEDGFGDFAGGVSFEFDGIAFETFEVEGGAAAREKFTFGSAGLTQNEGVVAAKSDRGRSRVTREFVLADDRFEEGVIGELFVGHTG